MCVCMCVCVCMLRVYVCVCARVHQHKFAKPEKMRLMETEPQVQNDFACCKCKNSHFCYLDLACDILVMTLARDEFGVKTVRFWI